MPGVPIFDQAGVNRILAMYGDGVDPVDIARRESCHVTTVRMYLRRNGVKLQKGGSRPGHHGTITQRQIDIIRRLYWDEGWSISMINQYFGRSRSADWTLVRMRYADIPRRTLEEAQQLSVRLGRNQCGRREHVKKLLRERGLLEEAA